MAPVQLSSQSQKAWNQHVAALRKTSRFEEHNEEFTRSTSPKRYRQLKLAEGCPGWKETQAVEERRKKFSVEVLTTLKYTFEVVGKPRSTNGAYPLFLTFHGGGDDVDNDPNWAALCTYYRGAVQTGVETGIYLSVRGIGDSWDMHFTEAGYELIQKLIENMVMFENADPNRVYILGFSAGGDGVYKLSAYLANRLAAGNMSAGHHNGTNLTNVINVPICLQVGENDTGTKRTRGGFRGFDRSLVAAECGLQLNGWAEDLSKVGLRGYECATFLHTTPDPLRKDVNPPPTDPKELYYYRHNHWESDELLAQLPRPQSTVVSNVADWKKRYDTVGEMPDLTTEKTETNTNGVDWVCRRVRNPVPQCIKWDLTTRPNPPDDTMPLSERESVAALVRKGQYYWLDIGARTIKDLGVDLIQTSMKGNTITIDSAETYLRILLRRGEGMPDLSQLITIVLPKLPGRSEAQTISVTALAVENEAVIEQTLALNDPSFIFTADIVLTQDASGIWSASRTAHLPALARL